MDGDAYDEKAVRRRATAAVLGALVADAATMGLHWIYDLGRIRALLAEQGRTEEPAFFQPPSCPYYQYDSGSLSPYGDELLPVLQYMTSGPGGQRGGTMDGPGFAQFLAEYYRAYPGRLNKSSRAMMEAVLQGGHGWPECGDPRDTQANNFVKVVPLVARYAGQPGLAAAVDAAVRAQQNNEAAVGYALAAALVLERVVMGHPIRSAIRWAAEGSPGRGVPLPRPALEALREVLRAAGLDPSPGGEGEKDSTPDGEVAGAGVGAGAVTPLRDLLYAPGSDTRPGSWGPSCANPGALQAALLAAVQASEAPRRLPDDTDSGSGSGLSGTGDGDGSPYAVGVRSNIVLGGDNCSRGVLLGALLAAQAGPDAIPPSWRAETHVLAGVEALVKQLLEHRTPQSAGPAQESKLPQ